MKLVTTCPACSTSFHVRQEQLAASQGRVRCGKCGQVFDALTRLGELPETTLPVEHESTPAATPSISPPATPPKTVTDTASRLKLGIRPKKDRTYSWLLAALLLLLLALLQTLYYLRTPITAGWPELRPHLEVFCAPIGCEIPLPRQAELLAIIDSDLQEDTERDGLIHLSATIVNNATFSQAYPVLELTLTNNYDKPVLRRPFTPAEYLSGKKMGHGLLPGEEVEVHLPLAVQDDTIAGYRLYVTYPPT